MDHHPPRGPARGDADAAGAGLRQLPVHDVRGPSRHAGRREAAGALRARVPAAGHERAPRAARARLRPRGRPDSAQPPRHLHARQLGRARDVGPVRHRVRGPSRPHPHPAAGRLGGPPAAARLPGGRRAGGFLRRPRDLADGPAGGLTAMADTKLDQTQQGITVTRTRRAGLEGDLMTVNFGPQHPSTHGVLRLVVDLDGENIRPGGVIADATPRFLELLDVFIREMPGHIDQYEDLLTHNPFFQERTQGVGFLSAEDAIRLGATGPMIRGSGVAWDLRRDRPYCGYDTYDWEVAVESGGDCYARYLVRIEELRQSVKILRQALDRLPTGPVNVDDRKMLPPPREELETSMEAGIHHFKLFTEGYSPPPGDVYVGVEGPRGEHGVYAVSDGTHKPRRIKFRSASFVNMQTVEQMALGSMLADMIAVIGTVDTVLGDVDR